MTLIPYCKQHINKIDKKIINQSLNQDLITTGPFVKKFENSCKEFLNSKYVVSCNSGTSAIHLALLAVNLSKNEIVIMPAINFIASFNMCKILGAKIYLADVDPITGQMNPKNVIDCIAKNKIKKIKLIITMYLGGSPENAVEFFKLKKKYSCYVIEDACHAFGAQYYYNNKKFVVGSCAHSDICTFSFHPAKTITTGEGGLISTNKKKIYEKLLLLRSHGIKRKDKHWEYTIEYSGFNYRISDINCALGFSQLKRVGLIIKKKAKLALFYIKFLKKYDKICILPKYSKNSINAHHLFLAHFKFNNKISKESFIKFMLKNNIILQIHYIPIFFFKKIFNSKKNVKKYFPGSIKYYKSCVSLPLYYDLNKKNLKFILYKIDQFFKTS